MYLYFKYSTTQLLLSKSEVTNNNTHDNTQVQFSLSIVQYNSVWVLVHLLHVQAQVHYVLYLSNAGHAAS
jgi:hypothetical protein